MNNHLSQEEHLIDYIKIILKRKYLVPICLAVTLSIATAVNYLTEPLYESKARILIDENISSSSISGMAMAYDRFQLQSVELLTHMRLITSFPVLERVYDKVYPKKTTGGPSDAEEKKIPIMEQVILFITEKLNQVKNFVINLLSSDPQVENPFRNDPEYWKTYKIRSLRGKISISQVKNTRLLELRVEYKNPKMAMDIANSLAQSYLDYTRYSTFEAAKVAIDWLSAQMEDMKREISASEKVFFDFKQREGIFSIEGKQRIQSQKIGGLTASFSDAKSKRMAVSAAIRELREIIATKQYSRVALGPVGNSILNNLHSSLINEEIELAGLKNIFTYQHAQIIALENKIAQTRQKFEEELKRTLSSLQSEYSVLENEELRIQSTIQNYESEALDLTKQEMQYTLLEREVEANKKLYDLLFNNFTEANVTKAMPTTNIILLEEAIFPLTPFKPRPVVNLLLGVILGSMLGIGLAFLFEYLDRSISSTDDLERFLALPVLAVIPKISSKKL